MKMCKTDLRECVISLQLTENGCPITGRWEDGELRGGAWIFSVDDCASEWGISNEECHVAYLRCVEFGRACNGYTEAKDAIRILRDLDEHAEII